MGDRCTTDFSEIVFWNRVISEKERRYRFAYISKVAAQRAATFRRKSKLRQEFLDFKHANKKRFIDVELVTTVQRKKKKPKLVTISLPNTRQMPQADVWRRYALRRKIWFTMKNYPRAGCYFIEMGMTRAQFLRIFRTFCIQRKKPNADADFIAWDGVGGLTANEKFYCRIEHKHKNPADMDMLVGRLTNPMLLAEFLHLEEVVPLKSRIMAFESCKMQPNGFSTVVSALRVQWWSRGKDQVPTIKVWVSTVAQAENMTLSYAADDEKKYDRNLEIYVRDLPERMRANKYLVPMCMRSHESGSTTHTVAPGDSNADVTAEVEVAHATEQGQSNYASDDGSEAYDTAGESEAESGGGQVPARVIPVSSDSDNDGDDEESGSDSDGNAPDAGGGAVSATGRDTEGAASPETPPLSTQLLEPPGAPELGPEEDPEYGWGGSEEEPMDGLGGNYEDYCLVNTDARRADEYVRPLQPLPTAGDAFRVIRHPTVGEEFSDEDYLTNSLDYDYFSPLSSSEEEEEPPSPPSLEEPTSDAETLVMNSETESIDRWPPRGAASPRSAVNYARPPSTYRSGESSGEEQGNSRSSSPEY